MFSIFDTLQDIVLAIGSDGRITYANTAATQFFKVSERKLYRANHFSEIIQTHPYFNLLDDLGQVSDPTPIRELELKCENGTALRGQVTLQRLPDQFDNRPTWLLSIRDVTLESTLHKKYHGELEQKEAVIEELRLAQTELEKYSKSLETMVEERTAKVRELSDMQTAMLDSLSEGFLVFTQDGNILPSYSKSCHTLFEIHPSQSKIWDLLRIPPQKLESFQKWLHATFSEMLPFEDMTPLAPPTVLPNPNKTVSLTYHPLRSNQQLVGIVLVAADETDRLATEQELNRERAHAELMTATLRNRKQISLFVTDWENCLRDLSSEAHRADKEVLLRALHTLKGGAANFSLKDVVNNLHEAEHFIQSEHELHEAEQVKLFLANLVAKLNSSLQKYKENAIELFGEKVLSTERFAEVPVSKLQSYLPLLKSDHAKQAFANDFILESIENLLKPYDYMIQEIAIQLEKEVEPIHFINGEIKVSPELLGPFINSLIHIFRNILDHGIESPSIRENRGKSRAGHITLECQLMDQRLLMTVADDGGGIDPDRIRAKAGPQGLTLAPNQLLQLIFKDNFSTRDSATTLSGRGIGLAAVAEATTQLNGTYQVESELGNGTRFRFSIPLILDSQRKSA